MREKGQALGWSFWVGGQGQQILSGRRKRKARPEPREMAFTCSGEGAKVLAGKKKATEVARCL
jgi:hypothetical protein